ncbi:beta-1,3-galactosyltransferase 4 [Pholidichthys leucotaenia]
MCAAAFYLQPIFWKANLAAVSAQDCKEEEEGGSHQRGEETASRINGSGGVKRREQRKASGLGISLWLAMVGRGMWVCKTRKRGAKNVIAPFLCAVMACAALLALLFLDFIELWVTSAGMNPGVAVAEPHAGMIPPQSVPPTRSEEFLLMPSPLVCQRAKPFYIAMVTSAPANQRARQAIRDTWGGEVDVRGLRVMTLFMVGVASDPGLAKLLIAEAREKGDLVQGRFVDTYSNLTLKTLAMLGWVRRFCPQAHFMAKVDDDVLLNPSALIHFLNGSRNPYEQGDLYLGRVHLRVGPDRDPDSKHYLPAGAYPPSVFPDYCSGTTYVLSRSALLKISLAASSSPLSTPLPPEDVFVGLCARAAGVLPTHCPLFSGGPRVPYSRCCYQAMVSVHRVPPRDMLRYWAEVHSAPPCSWLGVRSSLGVCKARAMLGTVLGLQNGL